MYPPRFFDPSLRPEGSPLPYPVREPTEDDLRQKIVLDQIPKTFFELTVQYINNSEQKLVVPKEKKLSRAQAERLFMKASSLSDYADLKHVKGGSETDNIWVPAKDCPQLFREFISVLNEYPFTQSAIAYQLFIDYYHAMRHYLRDLKKKEEQEKELLNPLDRRLSDIKSAMSEFIRGLDRLIM